MPGTAGSVIVVGGGAFGAASAWELARRGHRVRLFDPGPLPHPDAASTDVSKMVRMDYGHDEFYMALAMEAMAIWDRWHADWTRTLYHPDGFLLLSPGPLEDGTFEGDSYRLLASRGLEPERLGPAELASRFPAWSGSPYRHGYFNPRAGWAESAAVVSWLLDQARQAGVALEPGVRVTGLLERGSRVAGVLVGDARHEADRVVVAAGAWTPHLLPWLSDVMWPSGQPVLHFRVDDPTPYRPSRFPQWAADISRTGWYGFPALDDGRVKVANHGAGVRVDPDGPRPLPEGTEERFRDFLAGCLPDLAGRPVVARRLCLYCDTFDGDFWIDRDPDREGLVVAAGGSGHGFKFAPVLGGLVADRVEGRDNPTAARFRWRRPGAVRTEAARSGARIGSAR